MVGAGSAIYHLPGNVMYATVGLFVYINLLPEYELPSSTLFGQFWKFGKLVVGGTPSSPATPKEKIFALGLSICSWLPARQI